MRAQELEKESFELPTINSWRQTPSREQVRFAMDLCRSEMPYAERTATIATFDSLDGRAMSDLIDQLIEVRRVRLARLRRSGRRRR